MGRGLAVDAWIYGVDGLAFNLCFCLLRVAFGAAPQRHFHISQWRLL